VQHVQVKDFVPFFASGTSATLGMLTFLKQSDYFVLMSLKMQTKENNIMQRT
jgi:hypothetical protein